MQDFPPACLPSPKNALHLPMCAHRYQPIYKEDQVFSQRCARDIHRPNLLYSSAMGRDPKLSIFVGPFLCLS